MHCPDPYPFLRHEHNERGGEELLQRPTTRVPPSPPESGVLLVYVVVEGDIAKIDKANLGEHIPREHRVYGLGEFRATAFIDAARVYPDPVVAISSSIIAAVADLRGDKVKGRHSISRASAVYLLKSLE